MRQADPRSESEFASTLVFPGGGVALWYFPQTAVTTTTLASELFTVKDGQIIEIRLTFDRLSYVPQER